MKGNIMDNSGLLIFAELKATFFVCLFIMLIINVVKSIRENWK